MTTGERSDRAVINVEAAKHGNEKDRTNSGTLSDRYHLTHLRQEEKKRTKENWLH